jgi:hypothetical protein
MISPCQSNQTAGTNAFSTAETAGGEWKSSDVFADAYSAKQHAGRLLQGGMPAASVRVIQTRYYAWRGDDGRFGRDDDIGHSDGKDM